MKTSPQTRFLSLILALVLSFSLCPAALAASPFSDVLESHWAYQDIMACVEQEIVTGYEDGTFRPDDEVTGVQFVSMLARTFYNGKVEATRDAAPAGSPWYWPYVHVGEETIGLSPHFITIGNQPMIRADMAYAARSVMDTEKYSQTLTAEQRTSAGTAVSDFNDIPGERQSGVRYCLAAGVLTGMPDGKFHADQTMTRAQACAVVMRLFRVIDGFNPGVRERSNTPEAPEQTGLLANGKEPTVENVMAILDEIKEEYPTGTIWGTSDVPNTNYYFNYDSIRLSQGKCDVPQLMRSIGEANFSLKYACGGWMCMVSDRIFGLKGFPAREVTAIEDVRPGDISVSFDKNNRVYHVGIVLYLEETLDGGYHFGSCDGNSASTVTWSYPVSSAIAAKGTDLNTPSPYTGCYTRIFTRYPTDPDPADFYKYVVEKDF